MLKDVANNVLGAATHLKAIGTASYGQIRLTSQLVTVVEEISRNSSVCREQSETAVWNAGSLATVTAQFDELLEPLRDICLPRDVLPDDRPQPRPAGEGTAGKPSTNIGRDPDHLHEDLSVAAKN
jgi:hypothetical protein